MGALSTGLLVSRGFQIALSIVIIGLVADIRRYIPGCIYSGYSYYGYDDIYCYTSLRAVLDYDIFVGVIGLIGGAIGLVQFFLASALFAWVTLAIDGLTTLFFLAGGIALSVKYAQYFIYSAVGGLYSEAQASIAFLFLGMIVTAIAGTMVLMIKRRD